jgi:hypothetical protein
MKETEEVYIYQERIVVFLDVLGFKNTLFEFEQEAIKLKKENNSEFYISPRVNEFIRAFKDAIKLLDNGDLKFIS